VDFVITVGESTCVPASLTDSQVYCRPPTVIPNGNINDTFCPDHTVSIKVCNHVKPKADFHSFANYLLCV